MSIIISGNCPIRELFPALLENPELEFKLPIPLLSNHNRDAYLGMVIELRVEGETAYYTIKLPERFSLGFGGFYEEGKLKVMEISLCDSLDNTEDGVLQ